MKRILFIAPHRKERNPSQRFRFEYFLDDLERHGYACTHAPMLSAWDDRRFYSPGDYAGKAIVFAKATLRRMRDVLRAPRYDVVFVHREAIMVGTTLFERLFKRTGARLVFDFDDAVWVPTSSAAAHRLDWLKRPEKTAELIALSDLVLAGNPYLAEFARDHNANVHVVPTVIDTDDYRPVPVRRDPERVCIGWSGSFSTIQHFEHALPVLRRLKARFGERLVFKVIGDGAYRREELGIRGRPWRREEEVSELSSFDIGIMPLPDDEWSKGKCGLKGLQYMALEVPTVMSPVGVNTKIIEDGRNGFLAAGEDEWVEKLSRLIEDAALRRRLGTAGRQTVERRYSVVAVRDRYIRLFDELTASSGSDSRVISASPSASA